MTYNRYDSRSHSRELDAALVKGSNQQLSVFSCVFMLYIVRVHHLLLQHQNHLTTKKNRSFQSNNNNV